MGKRCHIGKIQAPRCRCWFQVAYGQGPELMAKWADSLLMLDESPTKIGVAGEWVRDVSWVGSKLRGSGMDSEMLMDVGLAKGDA